MSNALLRGTLSVAGVYAGLMDKFPIGSVTNRSLRIMSGQSHAERYMKPLLERIPRGDIDPTFVITHRLPLSDAAAGYAMFDGKHDHCEKIVLKAV